MTKRQPPLVLRLIGGFFKWLFLLLGTLILIGGLTGAILAWYAADYIQTVIMPEAEEATSALTMVQSDTNLTSTIYYLDNLTGKYQVEEVLHGSENRIWVSYEDIPENLINAAVAIEDKRFWTHQGVDWRRTARGLINFALGHRQEGGSTITQQLIKNITQNTDVTVKRKVLEIFEALEFDSTHTKQETLEWYLNIIYLGRSSYGVYTAAQEYFGKDLSELSLAECASLISITNNPSLYNPYTHPDKNKSRQELVLDQMEEQGLISAAQCAAAKREELVFQSMKDVEREKDENPEEEEDTFYSWYTDNVIEQVAQDLVATYDLDYSVAVQMIYSGGLQIYSCLDPNVQAQVDDVYVNRKIVSGHRASSGQELRSAISVVDNKTGAVVALAGDVGEKSGNRLWNMATQTLRSPGSSIKPLSVYAPALEMGIITTDSLIEDSSIRLSDGTVYPSSNSGKKPTGDLVTVQYGVQQSLNTVAVQVLQRVSPQYSFNFLQERFGITSLIEDYTGPSGKNYTDLALAPLALGGLTNGISVYEMSAAYATFARDGIFTKPFVYTVVTNSDGDVILAQDGYSISYDAAGNPMISGWSSGEPVLKESTVTQMDTMLQRVVTHGTAKAAALPDGIVAAGKTGTTNEDFDRWFCGYTEDYTAAVWSGYERAETINYDGNPSVDLWREVMERIYGY